MPDEQKELKYLIALTMAPAIGPVTARRLIKEVGSAQDVFRQKRKALESIEGIGPQLSRFINESSLLGKAERELNFMDKLDVTNRTAWALTKNGLSFIAGCPARLRFCQDRPRSALQSRGRHRKGGELRTAAP